MRRVAAFIVEKRSLILIFCLLLTVGSVWLMGRVNQNDDMTKYLPDDSAMKQGLEIMNAEFPSSISGGSGLSSFDIMFVGLAEAEKLEIQQQLAAVNNVSSVDYAVGSEDYNRGDYTLYRVNVGYGEYSTEAQAVFDQISQHYQADYQIEIRRSVVEADQELTPQIILLAVTILMVILFAMCASWFEPILFLVTIGIAVVINMGTNAFLSSVSSMTYAIASILQLVLSMDYSIILINRYRQELETSTDKYEAMRRALAHAFSAIASSSLTTIVGLLALVFMSFKIGMDMGIVLAKGVLISLLCIYTVLPGLILLFDRLIAKTRKPVLHIRLNRLGAFTHRARYGLIGLFAVLFVATYLLKGQTGIAYTLASNGQVDAVFPVSNTIVLLYGNGDEAVAAALADRISAEAGVKSATCYANTLDKPYTASELAEAMSSLGSGMHFDPALLSLVYYDIYASGQAGTMTIGSFVRFIREDLAHNPQFAAQFDAATLAQIDQLAGYVDQRTLQQQHSSSQLAGLLGMDAGMTGQVYHLYFAGQGATAAWKMTLPEFVADLKANFVSNPAYAAYFDSATLAQIELLATFTDSAVIERRATSQELAASLGMDQGMVQQLLLMQAGSEPGTGNPTMSLHGFVDFVVNDVASNQQFAGMFDATTLGQLQMVQQLMQLSLAGVPLSSQELAASLGMDAAMAEQVCYLHHSAQGATADWKMTLPGFVNFLLDEVADNPTYAAGLDQASLSQLRLLQQLTNAAVGGRQFTSAQLATLIGSFSNQLDAQAIDLAYLYYFSQHDSQPSWTLTMPQLIGHIADQMMHDRRFSGYFDAATQEMLTNTQQQLTEAAQQLRGSDYSRLIISTTLPPESLETTAFLDELTAQADSTFSGDHYLIGDSAMSYEMAKSFGHEMSFITLLTAIAIFVVVAVTFRSLLIPGLLVLVIQAAVYTMMCLIGLQGYSIYYIALLIVQCILMGATIDYGILYTTYYREKRATMDVKDALIAAYNGSIHTILTSSLIMILVTAILGNFFANPTIGQICQSISKGALCATLLIIFVLPGLLAAFDKFIYHRNKQADQAIA